MNIYTELLLVVVVVCFVVDVSGWSDTLIRTVNRWLRRYNVGPIEDLQPLTCSLCMVWWTGLAWALIRHAVSLPVVAYIAALASVSFTISETWVFLREAANAVVRWLMDRIER